MAVLVTVSTDSPSLELHSVPVMEQLPCPEPAGQLHVLGSSGTEEFFTDSV